MNLFMIVGIELASDTPDHRLIAADFDFKPAEQDIAIEFLPPKPKPDRAPHPLHAIQSLLTVHEPTP
jgi:hypothetical protein